VIARSFVNHDDTTWTRDFGFSILDFGGEGRTQDPAPFPCHLLQFSEMSERTPEPRCVCCGAADFTEGAMSAYGGLGFRPGGGKRFLTFLLLDRPEPIDARKCNACGSVQLFVPVKK
jgi:hypothetical protein